MKPKMNAYLKPISLFSRWQLVSVTQLSTKAMCCLNRDHSRLDSMPCNSAHSIQTQNSVVVQVREKALCVFCACFKSMLHCVLLRKPFYVFYALSQSIFDSSFCTLPFGGTRADALRTLLATWPCPLQIVPALTRSVALLESAGCSSFGNPYSMIALAAWIQPALL